MILYLLFFLSGASGLIYQVVWVREFGNVFGNTIHSAALVIAVFMLGLGLGSLLAGVWADRRWAAQGSLLRAYAWVELAIGALGFLITNLLPRLAELAAALSWYEQGADGWYALSMASYLARYAIAVVLLTPVTLLMGSTLTLLIRDRVQHDLGAAGWRIGALYGVNTAGAAAGCFLTDYGLIPHAGLFGTQMLAVGFNLVAALGAMQLAKREAPALVGAGGAAVPAPAAEPPARTLLPVGFAIALSGFVAMAMEIVWFRHLTSLLGGYRAVLSLILTVILIGIWLGSLLGGWLHRRLGRPALLYMASQALFVISTLAGLAFADVNRILSVQADALPIFLEAPGWRRELIQLWLNVRPVLEVLAAPALLMGFAYPLANACVQDAERAVGRRAGLLYLANTAGAVLGALAAGFLLLPWLGMQATVTVLAALAVLGLVPLAAIAWRRARPARRRTLGAAGLLTASAVAALTVWLALPAEHIIGRTVSPVLSGGRRLAMREGLTEIVAVYEAPNGSRLMVTNGHPMSGTWWVSQRYMRAFAHIPLLSMDAPERVLVICFGVGNTAHAASLHPSVQRVDVVDTSRNVLAHAGYFAAPGKRVLDDPKVAVWVNDGRHHLRLVPPASYDMVTLEPPPIAFAGVGSLYSREFYEQVRSRLKPGGYVTQWLPAYQVPEYATLAMVRAFVEVFPQSVLLSGAMAELILMGVHGDRLELDLERVRRRLAAAPAVHEDLTRVSLGTLTELVGTFAGSAATLAAATERSLPVTDDFPINEYMVSSRLVHHRLPPNLFEIRPVAAVADWCPRCFVNGRPAEGLELLPMYLRILSSIYSDIAFLEQVWPMTARPAPTGGRGAGSRLSPDVARVIASSRYLQHVAGVRSTRP